MFYKLKSFVAFFKFLTCLLISRPFYVIRFTWKYFFHYIKVHTATRWTIRHSLMLLWFADLMNVTEEVTIPRPNVSTLLSSTFIRGDLNAAQEVLLYIKVHTATRWTIRHSLKLLWFADLMNVTEEVTIHRPNVSTLLSSAFIRGDLNAATGGPFI